MQPLLEHLHPANWGFLWDALSALALRFCAAFAILWFGWWLSRRVGNWIKRRGGGIDPTLRPIVRDTAVWGVRLVAVIGALSQIGIQTASIVAVLGAAGLAIGLALQGTLQNIAAGIMLLLLRPFKVGDYIDGGVGATVAGTVEEVNLFTTRLTKPDGICEYVPNSALWSNSIRNYSRNPTRRLDLEVEVSVRDDVNRAIDVLRTLAAADARVLASPAPQVMVSRFDDSIAVLNVRVWSNIDTFWDMRWELSRKVRQSLNDAHCSLPLRTRELHIVQTQPAEPDHPPPPTQSTQQAQQ